MRSATIREITEFVLDGTHGSPVRTATGIPVLSAQNVKDGTLDERTDRYTSESEFEAFRRRLPLRAGDVLLTIVGTIGRAAVLDTAVRAVLQRSVAVLRARSEVVAPRFLYHATQSRAFQTQLSRGVNQSSQAGVYLGKLKELTIPVPPVSEQRRIAEILDRAAALRARRRAALCQLDTIAQAIFLDIFGDPASNPRLWSMARIGDISEVQGGLQLSNARQRLPIEVPYLRVANVLRGSLDLQEVKRIRVTEGEAARTSLREGDLLVVEGHGNPLEIGRSALWDGSVPGCVHQNHLIRVRFSASEILPVFACDYLNSPAGRRHLLRSGKTTSGLSTINITEVKATPIAIPPLEVQREYARRIEVICKLKSLGSAALSSADALFATLQDRAFRGEL